MKMQGLIGGSAVTALAAAMEFLAVPAAGQLAQTYDRARAEQAMADFARCVVSHRQRRQRAEQFLRTLPGDPTFQGAATNLSTSGCVPTVAEGQTRMRFQPDLLRASLFSALYQRDYGRAPAADLRAVPPLVIADEFNGPTASVPDSLVFTRTVSDCVARANAPAVHALLLTRISSREEQPALERVRPAVAQCLPAGRELRFSRSMLRGFLAEAMYKLRRAATASTAGSGRAPAREGTAQ